MGDVVFLIPVSQSCSGFAQSWTAMREPTIDARAGLVALDGVATNNVALLRSTHRLMEAVERAGRAARAAFLDEAHAIAAEALVLSFDTFRARTFAELLDLHGNFARRRYLAAASFTSMLLMPANDAQHTSAQKQSA